MRPIFPSLLLLSFLSLPILSRAQSDFKLAVPDMPRLEDAIAPQELPPALGDVAVRENLDAASTMSPKADDVLKQIVNTLKTRQFAEALPRLEYLQTLRPTEPDLLILRGCIYAESGRPEVAEGLFKKAIEIAPSHPWARLNLAEALLSQKKYPEAESTLTVLASTRPESEVVRFKLVLALALQKKTKVAEQELQFLKDSAATPAYYYANATLAFVNGDEQQGKDFVDQARKIYGDAQTNYFYNTLAAQGWLPKLP